MKICTTCKRTWEDDFRLCPIDGSSLQAMAGPVDSNIGMTVGQCRIVEKIADGDLGPIYKAEDPLRGVVALQVIPPTRIASPIILEALADAVKTASKLNHPRIIRIFGMETAADGSMAVSMEYVQGTTLENYRHSRPGMDTSEVCSLIRQVAEGLMIAHRASLMHGALHPNRIMIASDGSVKLGGFHKSSIREGVDATSLTNENMPYIAPECVGIMRDVPVPDFRADIYALGVILYEMLTARIPHEAKTLQELATLIETAPPLPPNFTNPQISPLLSRIVLKAISRHPAERQASIDEFIKELDATRQPGREPQRAYQETPDHYPSPFPPAPSSSSIFSAPSTSGQDSGIFSPLPSSGKRDSIDNILPDTNQGKAQAEDGSFFGWFKTRIDRGSGGGRRHESKPSSPSWDDSSLSGPSPRRGQEEEFSERTVVVSSNSRPKTKRRSFADTFADFRGRDADMTGTGILPKRRVGAKVWLIGLGSFVLLAGLIVGIYFLFFSTTKGRLIVQTNPPGAQVLICPDPCQDSALQQITTPAYLKVGFYRLRIQMAGYVAKDDRIEVIEKDDLPHFYDLTEKLPPPPPVPTYVPETTSLPPTVPQSQPPAPVNGRSTFAVPLGKALSARNFFPEVPGNAWDILQRWQQTEAGTPSPALEQAWLTFCRSLEEAGQEKLSLKDFDAARRLLDQIRKYMPGQSCASSLQSSFDKAVSNDKANLMISAQSAMDRQSYVIPEAENALKYVRQAILIDPNDADARRLEGEIFNRAWDQAKAVAAKRQHQEALDICNQLKAKYPNPPIGLAPIQEFIQKQTLKLEQYQALKPSYSVQVKHNHGRKYVIWGARECSGTLKIDGFTLEYKGNEPEHSFRVSYDGLADVKGGADSITIVHPGIRPEGRIELQEIDKRANPNLAQVYKKILEYRPRYAEYVR
jgi:serine/threonine protein kinase/tetratricopeptide (TPR) repeat protein